MPAQNETRQQNRGDNAYTLRQALKEAHEMLQNEFGDVDQAAAVALASTLYGAHERDMFLRANRGEQTPYDGPGDVQ